MEEKYLTGYEIVQDAMKRGLEAAKKGLSRDEYLNNLYKYYSAGVVQEVDDCIANTIPDDIVDKCVEMQQFCSENKVQALADVVKDTIGEENFNKLIVIGTITVGSYNNLVWWDSKADMNIGKIKYFRDKEKDRMKK